MARSRLLAVSIAACLGSIPAVAFDQRDVGTGHLPPIDRDYQVKIAAWGREFYANRNALSGARVSAPVLIRDETGRLLWLVCLDAPNAPPDLRMGGVQRQAFGFAPGYASTPAGRIKATLTRDDCDARPLTWGPFRGTVQAARGR